MYIIKIKGKAKIPDFIQLRNDDFILIEYFSAERPINKLRRYGIKATDEKILEYGTVTLPTLERRINNYIEKKNE